MGRSDSISVEDIIAPRRYADQGYPHEAWRLLREEAPLRYFDFGERPGFWAVVRRADIVWFSKQPARFLNSPRLAIFADSPPPDPDGAPRLVVRDLLRMDPPEHAAYRALASGWFTPRAIGRRRKEIEGITRDLLDDLGGREEADFVEDFA
ncbi:MAG: cytochrome P450, partial [Deltaproteobacteria bacterium]|nr:cytochrome P450 [Deltaproteobacteria bacterium]